MGKALQSRTFFLGHCVQILMMGFCLIFRSILHLHLFAFYSFTCEPFYCGNILNNVTEPRREPRRVKSWKVMRGKAASLGADPCILRQIKQMINNWNLIILNESSTWCLVRSLPWWRMLLMMWSNQFSGTKKEMPTLTRSFLDSSSLMRAKVLRAHESTTITTWTIKRGNYPC